MFVQLLRSAAAAERLILYRVRSSPDAVFLGAVLQYELNNTVEISSPRNDQLLVRTPSGDFLITDPFGTVLATLTAIRDGDPVEAAFSILPDGQRDLAVRKTLGMLCERRVIRSCDRERDAIVEGRDPVFDWLGHLGSRSGQTLRCNLMGSGLLFTEVDLMLREIGIQMQCSGEETPSQDVVIACFDDLRHEDILAANRIAVARNAIFLPAVIDRHLCIVGPLVIPGATACYECYYHRLRANQQDLAADTDPLQPLTRSRLSARVAAGHVVAFTVRFLTGAAFDLHTSTVLRHNVLDGRIGHSVVLKLPRCPTCGSINLERPLQPIRSMPISPEMVSKQA